MNVLKIRDELNEEFREAGSPCYYECEYLEWHYVEEYDLIVMGQEFENSMSHFLLLLSNRPKKTRCHKDKRHPTSKSDASFCLSHKVFLDKFSPWQHLFLKIRVDKARNSV